MSLELWVVGWGLVVVALARLRAKARRAAWEKAPGRAYVGPADGSADQGRQTEAFADSAPVASERAVDLGDGEENRTSEDSVVHRVPADVAEFLIPDFHVGVDLCAVELAYPDIDFVHWRGNGLSGMIFFDGAETLTVLFRGLDTIPSEDIQVHFDHPRKGAQCYRLSQLLDVDECAISEKQAMERRGVTPSNIGSGASLEDAPMEFKDFDVKRECVEVFVPHERISSTVVEVEISDDGSDACVVIDGRVAAILRGAHEATESNVKLVATRQTVAA